MSDNKGPRDSGGGGGSSLGRSPSAPGRCRAWERPQGRGWWVGVSGAGLEMHPNFHMPASEEGVLLVLGGASRLRVPAVRASPVPCSPTNRLGFGISAWGAARPLSQGQPRPLDAPQGAGLTGPRGTAWWARLPSSLLQTRGLGGHGALARGRSRLANALCKTWLKCMAEGVRGTLGRGGFPQGVPPPKLALVAGEAADFLPSPLGGAGPAWMLCWASGTRPFGPFRRGLGGAGAHWALPRWPLPHPHPGEDGQRGTS